MSSIFSDPGWRRGGTLLASETIEYSDPTTRLNPVAGNELVGQVKVFQDVNPSTGKRNSNRLVYCVAARYTGSSPLDPIANKGKAVVFNASNVLGEFDQFADDVDVTDGKCIGVLDEYLTVDVREDDIVWVVVKGPTTIRRLPGTQQDAGTAVGFVSATDNNLGTLSDNDVTRGALIGQMIAAAAAADETVRINLRSDHI